jgi:DegV family protein with EDD domain
MSGVAVVTDSTAYLPEGVAEHEGIGVVPLHVVLGRRTGVEGREVTPADVARALSERRVEVTTSRPTPAELAAAYRATGVGQVVSVHLSRALSGTYDAAVLAARDVAAEGVEVRVVDSRTIAMGLGFAVLAARRAAAAGAGPEQVEQAARDTAAATTCLFYVDTLEPLRRGGRIGAASALLGAALAVKPLLHVADGQIALREKVRTIGKALTRMVELAGQVAGQAPAAVAVHHLSAPDRAAELAERLRTRLPRLRALHVSEVGAVVGAHVGPGALAVVVCTR